MNETEQRDKRLAQLMRNVQSGDSDAYAELLADITPRLRRIVRRQRPFLQADDIEDLVQEILLSMHAVRGTYNPERPLIPWLLAIARNRLADSARRYSRQGAREVSIEDLGVTFSGETTNIKTEVYGDPEALRQAIHALPGGQRDAIELLKLREMSLKEAATATGTSVGALKVATYRAVTALRKLLKG